MKRDNKTLSLSILSGKGGVGKTSIALNLAFGLYEMNQDTLLVDCDLGLANLDVMLGISPEKSFQDILNLDSSIEESICRLEKKGLDLIPAASGVTDILVLDEDRQRMVVEKMNGSVGNYNYLIMDLGAGISPTVLSFARMTHHRILVITPEPTSLTDAYALIKVLYTRHEIKDFHVLVNMAESEDEAVAGYERLRAACERFLGLPIEYVGFVRRDPAVPDSVRRQKAFVRNAPDSIASRDVRRILENLIKLREGNRSDLSAMPPLSHVKTS